MTTGHHELEAAGHPRSFEVAAPDGLGTGSGTRTAPVIVLFHGYLGAAGKILQTTGLDRLGPAHGVVIVAPQGIGEPTSWHIGDDSFGDTEFTDAVLALVRASPCVDTTAIWLAGFSAGSAWTGVYGCTHADGIAGLLMHSGLPPAICPGDRTPNVMIVHGTADPVVPFTGGAQPVGGSAVVLAPVPESAASWATTAGCGADPTVRSVGDQVSITTWSGCAGGRTVSLQAVTDLGHSWSGGRDAPGLLNPGCVLVETLTGAADPVAACS